MHKPLSEHPENHTRIIRVINALSTSGISFKTECIESFDLSESIKLATRVHAKGYVDYLLKLSHRAPLIIDEDTYMSKDSLRLALGTLYASYYLALSTKNTVFVVSRPPGHHAGKGGRAMGASTLGFCLLNNAAGAVEGFRERGIRKIALLDFDAHHGNGTMEIYYSEKILQVDFHQDPDTLSPCTGYPVDRGSGSGFGYKVNIILPPGSGDDLFEHILNQVIALVDEYTPEALVVSAGFDAYENDGLADLRLTDISYYKLGSIIKQMGVPTIIVLEGGYGVGLLRGLISFTEGALGLSRDYIHSTRTLPLIFQRASRLANKVLARAHRKIARGV